MKLSRVQRKRFFKGVLDLEELTFLIATQEDTATLRTAFRKFKNEILNTLRNSPINEYVHFDLDGDALELVLKVDGFGRIVGYVSLHYKGKSYADPGKISFHSRVNGFIQGSSLLDPTIEYGGE